MKNDILNTIKKLPNNTEKIRLGRISIDEKVTDANGKEYELENALSINLLFGQMSIFIPKEKTIKFIFVGFTTESLKKADTVEMTVNLIKGKELVEYNAICNPKEDVEVKKEEIVQVEFECLVDNIENGKEFTGLKFISSGKDLLNPAKVDKLITSGKMKNYTAEELIIPKFKAKSDIVPLKSRLLFEQEGNPQPTTTKILETNIDELMKNKIDLLSKKTLNEQERSNLKGYGIYATYVGNENEKLRMYNFKINTKFSSFKFITMVEIEKGNYPNEKINYINSDNNINDGGVKDINDNFINDNNSNVNLNSDADFIMLSRGERLNNKSSRKNTNKSKKTESESVSSIKNTPSQRAAIQKV